MAVRQEKHKRDCAGEKTNSLQRPMPPWHRRRELGFGWMAVHDHHGNGLFEPLMRWRPRLGLLYSALSIDLCQPTVAESEARHQNAHREKQQADHQGGRAVAGAVIHWRQFTPEPFEPLTESQGQLVTLLETMLDRAKTGAITGFFWIAENTSGEYEQGFTPTENIYGLAGMALFSMMRQMGFVIKQDMDSED